MKKRILLVLLIAISINLVSSAYKCSDESSLTKSQNEIDINNRKSINGISLGLIGADETPATNSFSAELISDASKFSLTDQKNSTQIELKTGESTLALTNLTNNVAVLRVNAGSDSLEPGDSIDIGGLSVYVFYTEGTFPGTGPVKVDGIIGKEKISLHSNEPLKEVEIDNVEYLLELSSSSDNNAIIIVGKCETENASIIKVEDEVVKTTTTANESASNETIVQNDSVKEEEKTENETTTNQTQTPEEIIGIGKTKSKKIFNISLVSIVFFIAVILIVVFFILRYKMYSEELKSVRGELKRLSHKQS